jgi:hypothetical protein
MKRFIMILFYAAGYLLTGSYTESLSAPGSSLTFTVNRTGDGSDLNPGDGICDASVNAGEQCSLRAALEELNSQGASAIPHRIEFNIPGRGPFTIAVGTPLPLITVPVEIDGSTQPGASCPAGDTPAELMIFLDGSNGGSGLFMGFGSDGSTIHGLKIENFTSSGITLVSSVNTVSCNHLRKNNYGIQIFGVNNTIGGQLAWHRNVVSDNIHGIIIHYNNNYVLNNFIGTTADGTGAAGNSIAGIYVSGSFNYIGDADSSARNIISGNGSGILFSSISNNNRVLGNYIGVAIDGISPLPNNYHGIQLLGFSRSNKIGGTTTGEANRISHNNRTGVILSEGGGLFPTQNEIRGNSISRNGDLGIDLGTDGVTPNDPGDNDGGPNEQQNYPILSSTSYTTTLTATLNSQPNTTFNVDVYRSARCDPSGYGQGQEFVFTAQVTTDGWGQANFDILLAGLASPGDAITTTTTDPIGNTSEFSNCVSLPIIETEYLFYLPALRQ